MERSFGKRIRFRLWHLFVLVFAAAVTLAGVTLVVAGLGMKTADVEITGLTYEPNRSQLTFAVHYHNGVAWSATPVPSEIPTARFRELFGQQVQIQYRASRMLWLEPEVPAAVAHTAVQRLIEDFTNQQTKMGGVD